MHVAKAEVSVVLPYYNGSRFVKEALDSIAGQTFRDFEVLVIDDGSPDAKEAAYLKELVAGMRDERFRHIHKPNGGLSDARNFGVRQSRGEFIAFIDQDDYWKPEKLARQMQVLRENPGVELVFTDSEIRSADGTMARRELPPFFPNDFTGLVKDSYRIMLRDNFVPCASVLFRRGLIEKSGYSDRGFTVCPDYELFIRMARHTDFYYIHEPLFVYRFHEANTVRQVPRLVAERLLVLFGSPATTFGEKVNASKNFFRLMVKAAVLWSRKLAGRGA